MNKLTLLNGERNIPSAVSNQQVVCRSLLWVFIPLEGVMDGTTLPTHPYCTYLALRLLSRCTILSLIFIQTKCNAIIVAVQNCLQSVSLVKISIGSFLPRHPLYLSICFNVVIQSPKILINYCCKRQFITI